MPLSSPVFLTPELLKAYLIAVNTQKKIKITIKLK